MLTRKETEISHQVIKIINNIINTEVESEELKITLAENIRFDITHAFRAIDTHQKGYIIPNDVFQFMARNSYSPSLRLCQFFVYIASNAQDFLNYQNFVKFVVPKYDKEASMQCIARKLPPSNQLSFYLEEFLSRLIWKELEYLRIIEIEKMKLAQLCEWKFMTVFKLISQQNYIDKKMLDQFLLKMACDKLKDKEYIYFMTRFNRNQDKLIQRDEFSDAIFPHGYLLSQDQPQEQDTFDQYVRNHNNQLDDYLGKQSNALIEDDNYQFVPERHQFKDQNLNCQEGFVYDHSNRKYLAMDPQVAISNIVPFGSRQKEEPPQEVKTFIAPDIPIYQTFSPQGNSDPNSLLRHYNLPESRKPMLSGSSQKVNQSYQFLNQSPSYIRQEDWTSPPKDEEPINMIQAADYKKDLLNPFVGKGGNTNELNKKPPPQEQKRHQVQVEQTGRFHQQQDLNQSITQSQLMNYLQQPSNKDMLMMK